MRPSGRKAIVVAVLIPGTTTSFTKGAITDGAAKAGEGIASETRAARSAGNAESRAAVAARYGSPLPSNMMETLSTAVDEGTAPAPASRAAGEYITHHRTYP